MTEQLQEYGERADSGVKWLGNIPSHWVLKQLKQAIKSGSSISYGIVQPGEPQDDGVPFVQTTNMSRGDFSLDILQRTTKSIAYSYPRSELLGGEVILGIRASIGAAYVVPVSLRGCNLSRGVARIIPANTLDPTYLVWYLRSRSVEDYWGLSSQGSTFSEVSIDTVKKLILLAPPLEEQTQIVAFLNYETAKINALIEKQQQLIELLKEKRQAVISHAVTKGLNPDALMRDSGVEWLGKVPAHWSVCQLKFNTLQMQTGPFGSQLHAEDYIEDGIPLVNPAHMVVGQIRPESNCTVDEKTQARLARHKLSQGDLIIARRGEMGRCAVVRSENVGWLCGTGSLRATLSARLCPEYAYMLVSSEGVKAELSLESRGSTMDNLNTDTLGNIRIPVPPRAEQEAILQHVENVSGRFEALEQSAIRQSELLQERRTSLISAAVTGKIDVRGWKPPASDADAEVA